jgi:hypothetical protein
MVNADKKRWSTPRLRIFVRTRAEERVLTGCKVSTSTTDPWHKERGCTLSYWQCYYGCFDFVKS